MFSASAPTADIAQQVRHVRSVPNSEEKSIREYPSGVAKRRRAVKEDTDGGLVAAMARNVEVSFVIDVELSSLTVNRFRDFA